ncbi:MAG: peptidoglycan-binding protein [Bacteroidales bacterium]|nr:peptidoglycan-binding protein [Bacteroidales bacterium]
MAEEINSIFKLDSETIKLLQTKIGTKADGMIGSDTVKKLQIFLNQEINASLKEDGKLGPKTMKALQEYAGVEADGIFGPQTANALKLKLMENESGEQNITSSAGLDAVMEKYMREHGIGNA